MHRGFASVVALPAWARFMTAAMDGERDQWLDMPGSLIKVKICRLSGMIATDVCRMPVVETASYDPTRPELRSTAGTVRGGSVYEDVMPADRVPLPCNMPHGTHSNDPLQAPDYDPSRTAPAFRQAAAGTRFEVPEVVHAARSMPISAARPPVAAPPAFMTDRSVRTVTTTLPPSSLDRTVATPTVSYPMITGATPMNAPQPTNMSDGVVPGATIELALPAAPGARRPSQQ
jgi:hypothetical protein